MLFFSAKNRRASNTQHGFTLIEISLVLLIIGLLLGGVLKGQELVEAARVRNIANSGTSITAAYYGFFDRYRKVPGDWDTAQARDTIGSPAMSNGGNNDGQISTIAEAAGVWEQLSRSGFISGQYNAETAVNDANSYQAPINPYAGEMLLSHNSLFAGNNANRLVLHLGGMPVDVAQEIDKKIDDGNPVTGTIRVSQVSNSTTGLSALAGPSGCLANNSTNTYNVAAGERCNVAYLIE